MANREDDAAFKLLVDEVDEDLKREQYAKLWKKYGALLVAAALGIVLSVAGYQGWRAWETQARMDEAQRYAAALQADEPLRTAEALAGLGAEAATGYGALARLRRAAVLAEAGDPAAVPAYEAIASDSAMAPIYRDLANLRLAMLTFNDSDPAALEGRLQPLTAGGPWRHAALELTAALAQRGGDSERAREIYRQLADDMAAPQGVRARAAEMLAALGGGARKSG